VRGDQQPRKRRHGLERQHHALEFRLFPFGDPPGGEFDFVEFERESFIFARDRIVEVLPVEPSDRLARQPVKGERGRPVLVVKILDEAEDDRQQMLTKPLLRIPRRL
jgi:hypothetical protein